MTLREMAGALHLASSVLPVGAYSYSQGLEAAVAHALVVDETTAFRWIKGGLASVLSVGEAAYVAQVRLAWSSCDLAAITRLNAWFVASRESVELRRETLQMGWSLKQLAVNLGWFDQSLNMLEHLPEPAYPTIFAGCGRALQLSAEAVVLSFCYSWCESQTLAAMKAIPIGQSSGQRILNHLRELLPQIAEQALGRPEEELIAFAPGLGILASRHEKQYSRLFRS